MKSPLDGARKPSLAETCNLIFKTRRGIPHFLRENNKQTRATSTTDLEERYEESWTWQRVFVPVKSSSEPGQLVSEESEIFSDRKVVDALLKGKSLRKSYNLTTPFATLRQRFESYPGSTPASSASIEHARDCASGEQINANTPAYRHPTSGILLNKSSNFRDQLVPMVEAKPPGSPVNDKVAAEGRTWEISPSYAKVNQSKSKAEREPSECRLLGEEKTKGMLSRGANERYQHPVLQRTQYQNRDYYDSYHVPDKPYYDQGQSNDRYYEYDHSDMKNDDVFHTVTQGYHDLTTSSSSLEDEFVSTPEFYSARADLAPNAPYSSVAYDYRSASSFDQSNEAISEVHRQPVVKLRAKKARDRGFPIERPRSWHASKQLEATFPSEERNMRSPVTSYSGSPSSQSRFYQQPLAQSRRRSKGWYESGELKSVYKEVDGSKDSLISRGSPQSYKSERLSVSSSKSSGTMSSSRGSLDNAMENNYHSRLDGERGDYLTAVHSMRHKASSKPQSGIVSQQKSIFERLSQETHADTRTHPFSKHSHEDVEKMNRGKRISSDDSDNFGRNQSKTHCSWNDRKSPFQSENNSRRSSLSPPPVMHTRTRSRGSDNFISDHQRQVDSFSEERSSDARVSSPRSSVLAKTGGDIDVRCSDSRISRNSIESHRRSRSRTEDNLNQEYAPDPPARDKSSVQAVKSYNNHAKSDRAQEHSRRRSNSPSSPVKKLMTAPSPKHSVKPPLHSHATTQQTAIVYPVQHCVTTISSTEPSHRLTVTRPIEKSVETSKVSGVMFGVLSVGNSKNIVATSVTVSNKIKDQSKLHEKVSTEVKPKEVEMRNQSVSPYEHLKDFSSGIAADVKAHNTDCQPRKTSWHKDNKSATDDHKNISDDTSSIEHSRSGSSNASENADSGKGKYGSVWKTPQKDHNRRHSADFTSVLHNWTLRESSGERAKKLSVYKSKDHDTHLERPNKPTSDVTIVVGQSHDNCDDVSLPSDTLNKKGDKKPENILRSLENSQHGIRRYKDFQPKTSPGDYDMIWYSEPKTTVNKDRLSVHEKVKAADSRSSALNNNNKKSSKRYVRTWTTEFKEVDLDESPEDDAFGTLKDTYCNHIKDMSRKVLRVTSFTRKDLDVSSANRSIERKKKQFQSSPLSQQEARPAVIHNRSHSQGNEVDEGKEHLSSRSKSQGNFNETTSPIQTSLRPKSAGVIRPNRHAPAQRTTVIPSYKPSFCSKKSESLPRNMIPSYHSDKSSSPTSEHPSKQLPSPSGRNKRISVDVMPNIKQSEVLKNDISDQAKRKAVLNYLTRKTGRSFDDGSTESNSTSSNSDETERRRSKEITPLNNESRTTKQGSPELSREKKRSSFERKGSPPVTNPRSDHLVNGKSTRKLQEKEDDFVKSFARTQSSSSLLEEELLEDVSQDRRSPLTFGDRYVSLENLTDSGLDSSRASPSEKDYMKDSFHKDKLKTSLSPSLASQPSAEICVRAPPRKHHRPRHSNSSSVSSATTISTLSSFSSASSASVGRFPALGEENEHPASRLSSPPHRKTSLTSSNDHLKKNEEVSSKEVERLIPRVPIDTGTYRVEKRRKNARKSEPVEEAKPESTNTFKSSAVVKLRSTVEIRLNSPRSESAAPDKSTSTKPTADGKDRSPCPQEPPTPAEVRPRADVHRPEFGRVPDAINATNRSDAFRRDVVMMTSTDISPPPLDGTTDQFLKEVPLKRTNHNNGLPIDFVFPSPPPSIERSSATKMNASSRTTATVSSRLAPQDHRDNETEVGQSASVKSASTVADTFKNVTYPSNADSESEPTRASASGGRATAGPALSENVGVNGVLRPLENVFRPIEDSAGASASRPEKDSSETLPSPSNLKRASVDRDEPTSPDKPINSPPPEVSPHPLLPDVSMLPDSFSMQPQLIIQDKALAQVLTSSSKRSSHYMTGVLPQSSHEIVEEGMRYRRNKPIKVAASAIPLTNDISNCDNLPASSAYYQTSASKAKILNLAKEKIADGEDDRDQNETLEDVIRKKVELVISIETKLKEFKSLKDLMDVEMRENECLGKQVYELTKGVCTKKEQEKYTLFVRDVDMIINLLLSLSGRLARVENTIQMLPTDAEKQEMEQLFEKRKRLTDQLNEAKLLKENIDRRQKAVSEILAGCFGKEQFADYEHYIKMKSALIMEQRELDDKAKLGEEQMRCLRESLPNEWQTHLDKLVEELESKAVVEN